MASCIDAKKLSGFVDSRYEQVHFIHIRRGTANIPLPPPYHCAPITEIRVANGSITIGADFFANIGPTWMSKEDTASSLSTLRLLLATINVPGAPQALR